MKLSDSERALLIAAAQASQRNRLVRETAWTLFTGAPGSGKTTTARMLREVGVTVIEDQGRAELEAMAARCETVGDARQNYLDFQIRVLRRYQAIHEQLDSDPPVVFDYGIADSLVFMKQAGLSWPEEFISAAVSIRYKSVFIFEYLLLTDEFDGGRIHGSPDRIELSALMPQIYTALGYEPIFVPALARRERVDFVLTR